MHNGWPHFACQQHAMITEDVLSAWLMMTKTTEANYGSIRRQPLVIGKVSFSIQASEYYYCTPRDNKGAWTHVEVGINGIEHADLITRGILNNHAGSVDDGWVFAYMPLDLLVAAINAEQEAQGKCVTLMTT